MRNGRLVGAEMHRPATIGLDLLRYQGSQGDVVASRGQALGIAPLPSGCGCRSDRRRARSRAELARIRTSSALSWYSPRCGGLRHADVMPLCARTILEPAHSGAGTRRSGASAAAHALGVGESRHRCQDRVTRVLLTLTSRSCGVAKKRMSSAAVQVAGARRFAHQSTGHDAAPWLGFF